MTKAIIFIDKNSKLYLHFIHLFLLRLMLKILYSLGSRNFILGALSKRTLIIKVIRLCESL